MEKNKFDYSVIVEGAYLLVITQNIFLFSKPIVAGILKTISFEIIISFLLIGIINLGNLVANWIASKSNKNEYSGLLLALDILSLSIIAIFTQVVSEFISNDYILLIGEHSFLISIFGISYTLLYLSFLIWNICVDKEKTFLTKLFSFSNVLICIYCIFLILTTVFNMLNFSNFMFYISIILSFIILIRYYVNLLRKPNLNIKIKANWLGKMSKIIKQFLISIKSYLIFIFVKKDNKRIKKYFSDFYGGVLQDDFIFDSKISAYLDKLNLIIDQECFENSNIIDLGCGQANLFNWLEEKNIKYKKYFGYDFAVKPYNDDKKQIFKRNIVTDDIDVGENDVVFLINVLCYLNDKEFAKLKEKIKIARRIIIIEPIPSLYWDATFDKIKLFYRRKNKIKNMFLEFELIKKSTDYLIQISDLYIYPLSSCFLFNNVEAVDAKDKEK